MQEQFSHFLISRFYTKQEGWIFNEEDFHRWMKDRIVIFEKITLPSLTAQTNKNFRWLILFDPIVNEYYPNFIQKLQNLDFVSLYSYIYIRMVVRT